MLRSLIISVFLILLSWSAQAALIGRAALTPGGTDYQAYYDDVLNITWLADANLSRTLGYDDNGRMNRTEAQGWIASLNAQDAGRGYLGVNAWRLPAILDTGTVGCNFAYAGTDCGFNVQSKSGSTVYSEMAHLYYFTLGNSGQYNSSGTPTGCSGTSPWCLTTTASFANMQVDMSYWSGTAYATNADRSWTFYFHNGEQYVDYKGTEAYAWAVRGGDIAPVPVPPAVWLFGSALGVMGWMRRKISS